MGGGVNLFELAFNARSDYVVYSFLAIILFSLGADALLEHIEEVVPWANNSIYFTNQYMLVCAPLCLKGHLCRISQSLAENVQRVDVAWSYQLHFISSAGLDKC